MCENKVGDLISILRKEKGMTQKELADKMHLSDRTISKWERGKGYPDISLLTELSAILGVDIEQLLAGELNSNERNGGNMKRIQFYVCPECQNVLWTTGKADISCCGRRLEPQEAKQQDQKHSIVAEEIDNEYYVTVDHDMNKEHYISFIAYAACDRIDIVKLYPEQNAAARFPLKRGGVWYACCSKDGLYTVKKMK